MNVDNPMKEDMAIVAITTRGVALGRRLKQLFPGSYLYLPERFAVEPTAGEYAFTLPVKQVVTDVFARYRHLILIMAVGIAVRLIASEVRDKHKDPGVVVIDDAGSFSVSLLSGHEGGANQLARKVASLLGAHPVVTTASEVSETIGYRPQSLVIGIGCNRGTKAADIEKAVTRLFSERGLSIKSIRNIATIDLKKNEVGLLQFAQKYGLPIEYFDKQALSQVEFPSEPSATVLKQVGIPAVCETAALLSSRNSSLIVPKASYDRAISIAVAGIPSDSHRLPKRGKLFLVGLGPGDPMQMTFRAREALNASEVVIGYKSYIELIEPLIAEKEVIVSDMAQEVQRAKLAIKSAQEGKTVSVIGSGDSGVYGMAGLVVEILSRQGGGVDVEVIPGVPALVASAALLGAPVTGDFACISLSDYLVPWEEISHRLKMAAQANFVIIIYNPRSKKRQHQLAEAREIIRRHRPPMTPVGIVRNAYRQKQEVVVTDLEHMLDYEVGMNTTIIIGNSSTFTFDSWMVTPRGYETKYDLSSEVPSVLKKKRKKDEG